MQVHHCKLIFISPKLLQWLSPSSVLAITDQRKAQAQALALSRARDWIGLDWIAKAKTKTKAYSLLRGLFVNIERRVGHGMASHAIVWLKEWRLSLT